MVEPRSALDGHLAPGRHGSGPAAGPGIRLAERRIAALWQVAAWPDRLDAAGAAVARAAGAESAPGPLRAVDGTAARAMRIEPLKWWLVAEAPLARPEIEPAEGTVLDLGHARTVLRLEGPALGDLMARLVSLDLRDAAFPEGAVAATGMHHVGVTLTRRAGGIDLYLPRSFALSLVDYLLETAAQFGIEIG